MHNNQTIICGTCKQPKPQTGQIEQCETCAYCITKYTVAGMGECRANPPVKSPDEVDETPRWPLVFLDDWCGCWYHKSSGQTKLFVQPPVNLSTEQEIL